MSQTANEHLLANPIDSYSYPWGHWGAISRIFSNAGIPHAFWGDPILSFHGVDQATITVAILIEDDQLNRATEILVEQDLKRCTCVGDPGHLSEPRFNNDTPVHFCLPQGELHLCPASYILNQVPLTGSLNHPNPLGLSFVEYAIRLVRDDRVGVMPILEDELLQQSPKPTDYQLIRFLDKKSVLLVSLYMLKAWRERVTKRAGIGLGWRPIVRLIAGYADQDNTLLPLLPDGPLRDIYARLIVYMKPDSRPPLE